MGSPSERSEELAVGPDEVEGQAGASRGRDELVQDQTAVIEPHKRPWRNDGGPAGVRHVELRQEASDSGSRPIVHLDGVARQSADEIDAAVLTWTLSDSSDRSLRPTFRPEYLEAVRTVDERPPAVIQADHPIRASDRPPVLAASAEQDLLHHLHHLHHLHQEAYPVAIGCVLRLSFPFAFTKPRLLARPEAASYLPFLAREPESTYGAAAQLAGWTRHELERGTPGPAPPPETTDKGHQQ